MAEGMSEELQTPSICFNFDESNQVVMLLWRKLMYFMIMFPINIQSLTIRVLHHYLWRNKKFN